jgi:hypothetical protein
MGFNDSAVVLFWQRNVEMDGKFFGAGLNFGGFHE